MEPNLKQQDYYPIINTSQWNVHYGKGYGAFYKSALRASLKSFSRALLLGCSLASLYYFQDFLLRSLHLEHICSSLWALF